MRPFVWNPWLMAQRQPDRVAVVAENASLTFRELAHQALHICRCLEAVGIGEDAVVTTDVAPGPDFFALALAALRGGYRLLPVPAWCDGELRASLIAEGRGQLDIRHDPADVAGSGQAMSFAALVRAGSTTAPTQPATRAGCLSFVTSGTTGEPIVVGGRRPWYPYRGVAVMNRYHAGPDRGPHVMANPTHHLGTLGPAMYAIQAGSAVVVQPEWSPDRFVALIDEHRADSAFVAPSQLVDLTLAGNRPRHDLKVVMHGGSHCAPELKRSAIALLGPVLHEFYGTSHGVIAEIGSEEWLSRPGSVGRPLAGVTVTIERGGEPVAPAQAGEICVTFRPVDQGEALTVRTGDLGAVDSDGYLYVLGRMSDTADHDSPVLEDAVRQLPGVVHALVYQGKSAGPVTCLVETTDPTDELLAPRIAELAASMGIAVANLSIQNVGTHLRTASGKLRRPRSGAVRAEP